MWIAKEIFPNGWTILNFSDFKQDMETFDTGLKVQGNLLIR